MAGLLPLVGVIVGLVTYSPAFARTYFQDLPAGVLEVSIVEGLAGTEDTPIVPTTQPTFQGQMQVGTTSITLTILSVERSYTVPVEPVSGRWTFTVPAPLEVGEHSLLINADLVGTFIVQVQQPSQPVAPPGAGGSQPVKPPVAEGSRAVTPPVTGGAGLLFSREQPGPSVLEQAGLVVAVAALTLTGALMVRRVRGAG